MKCSLTIDYHHMAEQVETQLQCHRRRRRRRRRYAYGRKQRQQHRHHQHPMNDRNRDEDEDENGCASTKQGGNTRGQHAKAVLELPYTRSQK
jgi:hypothetical protein